MCINSAQDELHLVYNCIQESFQNNLKECNNSETSTSFYKTFTYFVWIVRLGFILGQMIYQTDDLCVLTDHPSLV